MKYQLDVEAVMVQALVIVHLSEGGCGVEFKKPSKFNSLTWAAGHGYDICSTCILPEDYVSIIAAEEVTDQDLRKVQEKIVKPWIQPEVGEQAGLQLRLI